MSENEQLRQNRRPFRNAKHKACAEIRKIYYPKKRAQIKAELKRLEPISEIGLYSDDNNNTMSNEVPTIFNELNITDDNHRSEKSQESAENTKAPVPITVPPNDSVNINNSSEGNLDDSIILIEPEIEVIELLEDSFASSFSDLSTDDSTDDSVDDPLQNHQNILWSSRKNVNISVIAQGNIKHQVIDTLFGCDPMTVDLLEIFPGIEPKLTLRRRSTAHWTTPPRYSMLPKH